MSVRSSSMQVKLRQRPKLRRSPSTGVQRWTPCAVSCVNGAVLPRSARGENVPRIRSVPSLFPGLLSGLPLSRHQFWDKMRGHQQSEPTLENSHACPHPKNWTLVVEKHTDNESPKDGRVRQILRVPPFWHTSSVDREMSTCGFTGCRERKRSHPHNGGNNKILADMQRTSQTGSQSRPSPETQNLVATCVVPPPSLWVCHNHTLCRARVLSLCASLFTHEGTIFSTGQFPKKPGVCEKKYTSFC